MSTPVSHLNDLPNPSDFGEAFNYALWTPNTQIELCNVPWNSDYRDIVDFATQAALDAYLNTVAGPKVLVSKMTLARVGDPVKINLPFAACYKYNYLRVNNGVGPTVARYVDGNGVTQTVSDTVKTLYYFIQDVSYLAPNTTQLTVMLDVWQTFGRDIEFGNCYIERGHIGVANSNQMNHNGRDYLTVPEALDVGPEYNVNETYRYQIPDQQDNTHPGAWVVVGIGADVSKDPGDETAPNLTTTSNLSNTDGMPNGFETLYFKTIDDFKWFISNFSNTPWITQAIMFITLIPPLHDVTDFSGAMPADVWSTADNAVDSTKAYHYSSNGAVRINRKIATAFRDRADDFIPSRYQYLKKFLTAPYMWIELTTYNAAPLLLRPELIPSDDLNVDIYQHSAPPSPRWAIVPSHYNATGTAGPVDDGEFLDFATYITNFPQFTVLNNNYLAYLASNRNSIAYGYSSADWSQQKALQGASTDYWNTQAGIVNTQNQALIQRLANTDITHAGNIGRVSDALMGAGGKSMGAAGGANPIAAGVSALTGGANAAVDIARANAENSIRNNRISESTNSQVDYARGTATRNYDYAKAAAKGDYQNSINAVQARVQDAKLIQPSSVGQLGGETFIASLFGPMLDPGSGGSFDQRDLPGWRIYAKLKQISPGYMAIIGEYWLRYGYAVNRFGSMPSSLKCMSKFTYWKLKESYITSSLCPEVFKQTIRGIFEKGVTVWSTPTDIGNVDLASNEPLAGISL